MTEEQMQVLVLTIPGKKNIVSGFAWRDHTTCASSTNKFFLAILNDKNQWQIVHLKFFYHDSHRPEKSAWVILHVVWTLCKFVSTHKNWVPWVSFWTPDWLDLYSGPRLASLFFSKAIFQMEKKMPITCDMRPKSSSHNHQKKPPKSTKAWLPCGLQNPTHTRIDRFVGNIRFSEFCLRHRLAIFSFFLKTCETSPKYLTTLPEWKAHKSSKRRVRKVETSPGLYLYVTNDGFPLCTHLLQLMATDQS